jgi:hypothetical protein
MQGFKSLELGAAFSLRGCVYLRPPPSAATPPPFARSARKPFTFGDRGHALGKQHKLLSITFTSRAVRFEI